MTHFVRGDELSSITGGPDPYQRQQAENNEEGDEGYEENPSFQASPQTGVQRVSHDCNLLRLRNRVRGGSKDQWPLGPAIDSLGPRPRCAASFRPTAHALRRNERL